MAVSATWLKYMLAIFSVSCFFVAFVVLSRTVANHCDDKDVFPVDDTPFDSDDLLERLSNALKFQTVTYGPKNYRSDELSKFVKYIIKSYPLVHSSPLVQWEIVNELSLLYHVKGNDTSAKPYLLSAHMDVVPVQEDHWEVPPFSGSVKDDYMVGRGSIDAKDIVLGILESLEYLLKSGYVPQRSFYVAFGHDEEGGGVDGASHIAQRFKSLGIRFEFVLDEGAFVLNNSVPGVNVPVAMVGITEKGSLNLLLSVAGNPGHSSIPPHETSIVILGKAVSKLTGDAFPSMLYKGSENEFFESVAKCSSFFFKLVYSNVWLFGPAINWVARKRPEMNALIRTTVAVTKISGGSKDNVLPGEAHAVVNIRIHPAQTISETIDYVSNIISDERVNISVSSSFPPHPISPVSKSSFGFMTIKKTVKQIFPDSCVAPVTLVGNTDSKWYLDFTDAVYRFSPVNMNPWELSRFHGHNEKISVVNYIQLVKFYLNLIKNANSKNVEWMVRHTDEL